MYYLKLKSFRKFQETVESKSRFMKNAIVNSKPFSGFEDTNNNISGFIKNILKERVQFVETELKSKDPITEFLTKQLNQNADEKSGT